MSILHFGEGCYRRALECLVTTIKQINILLRPSFFWLLRSVLLVAVYKHRLSAYRSTLVICGIKVLANLVKETSCPN